MRAGIALGSNMGDRLRLLRQARSCIIASRVVERPVLASRIYLTSPMDCTPDTPHFLNAVIEVELTGEPEELIRDLLACEEGLGRGAKHQRNAPRTIDLDLLYAGDRVINTPKLVLPHPRMAERRFVLAPLAELRPTLVLPGEVLTIAGLLRALSPGDSAEPVDETW